MYMNKNKVDDNKQSITSTGKRGAVHIPSIFGRFQLSDSSYVEDFIRSELYNREESERGRRERSCDE